MRSIKEEGWPHLSLDAATAMTGDGTAKFVERAVVGAGRDPAAEDLQGLLGRLLDRYGRNPTTLEVQILELLRELQENLHCSILFISHHLGVIAELCDEVYVMYAGEVVERGTVRDIFHRPSHPYTRKLLECDPARIASKTRSLPTIPGGIPDLVNVPQGCIFKDRCPEAQDVCARDRPELEPVASGHETACHLR